MVTIGHTELEVFPLCLGGNVFGWSVDEAASFAVLDAYAEAGGNFIDTADVYSEWVPGNSGGESETIIGRWLASRGNRDRIVLATKVGKHSPRDGLAGENIRRAVEDSLRRLQTDRIDLYYAHRDDADVPLGETLGAFDELVRSGLVRYVAASNYDAPRLVEALAASESEGLASYVALQPSYNLVERREYEGALEAACAEHGVACIPYYGLAMGFLTGKYRPGAPVIESPRAGRAREYLNDRGIAVLNALDRVAADHETTVAAVALAWLAAQPTVATPIASARTPEQLAELVPMAALELSADELAHLDTASR